EMSFSKTTFKHGVGVSDWAPGQTDTSNPNNPRIRLGVDSPKWSGTRLIIPRSFSGFEDWLVGVYPGMIIATGQTPISTPWAYISAVSAPADGSALWLDTVWFGTQPRSGNIYRSGRYRRLIFSSDCTFASGTTWNSPGFMAQTSAPFGTNYDFPAGLPPPYNE